jgi:hypothetical protein
VGGLGDGQASEPAGDRGQPQVEVFDGFVGADL